MSVSTPRKYSYNKYLRLWQISKRFSGESEQGGLAKSVVVLAKNYATPADVINYDFYQRKWVK